MENEWITYISNLDNFTEAIKSLRNKSAILMFLDAGRFPTGGGDESVFYWQASSHSFFISCAVSNGWKKGVNDGIKAGIRTSRMIIEGKDMNTTEKPGQQILQQ